jgi:hypothetical protein
LTAAESLVAGSRIDIPFGGESYVFEANGDEQTKRAAFVAAFSSPKKLKQEIVVVGEGGGSTIEPLDVEIDSNYAGAVFDAAIQLVTTSSNVAVKAKTMDRAAWTTEAEGSEVINVDPQRIRNSYANEEVAASYDGFWILLHELFHRGPADVFKNLADAQNQTFLANNDTQASYRKRGPEGGLPPDEKNWRGDPDGLGLNPVESFLNVLRLGFGLPLREQYGKNTVETIPFEAKSGSKKPGEDLGVTRPSAHQTSWDSSDPIPDAEVEYVQELIDVHYRTKYDDEKCQKAEEQCIKEHTQCANESKQCTNEAGQNVKKNEQCNGKTAQCEEEYQQCKKQNAPCEKRKEEYEFWSDRLKQAHIVAEDPADFAILDFAPISGTVTSSEFELTFKTNDNVARNLWLHAGWGIGRDGEADDGATGLPMPHIGTIFYKLEQPGGTENGEGEFWTENPFYTALGAFEYKDNPSLFGYLSADPRPGFVAPGWAGQHSVGDARTRPCPYLGISG